MVYCIVTIPLLSYWSLSGLLLKSNIAIREVFNQLSVSGERMCTILVNRLED